eukprot:scaffold11951_cov14-Tisochrysis_lutea.AAC.1
MPLECGAGLVCVLACSGVRHPVCGASLLCPRADDSSEGGATSDVGAGRQGATACSSSLRNSAW